jgi:hypothetical protein
MDGPTEAIIVVIGHPIAGNPAQFATERALRSLKLDWRVLSFDVKPEDVATALDGFAVTGIQGVIIDSSLAAEARQWFERRGGGPGITPGVTPDATPEVTAGVTPEVTPGVTIDCLSRDEDLAFSGGFEQQRWVDEQISRHGGEQRLWIGQRTENSPASVDGFRELTEIPVDIADLVGRANVIVISGPVDDPIRLESEEWPADDGSTLVIDLTAGHPEAARIKQLGYRVIGDNERRIGMLQRCLHRLTGHYATTEVIHDAIEEYLSV